MKTQQHQQHVQNQNREQSQQQNRPVSADDVNAVKDVEAIEAIEAVKEEEEDIRFYLPFNVPRFMSIGLYMVIERLADESGLLTALTKQFSEEDARLILDIAMFLLTGAHRTADIETFPLWASDHQIFSSIESIHPVDKRTGDDLIEFFITADMPSISDYDALIGRKSLLAVEQLKYIDDEDVEAFKELWSSVAPRQMRKEKADAGPFSVEFEEDYDPQGVTIVRPNDDVEELMKNDEQERLERLEMRRIPEHKLFDFVASVLYSLIFTKTYSLRQKILIEDQRDWPYEVHNQRSTMREVIYNLDEVKCLVDFAEFDDNVQKLRQPKLKNSKSSKSSKGGKDAWNRTVPINYKFAYPEGFSTRQKQVLRAFGITNSDLENVRKSLSTSCSLNDLLTD